MGYPGKYEKDVQEALLKIDEIAKKLNKPLGFHVAIDSDCKKTLEKINKGLFIYCI